MKLELVSEFSQINKINNKNLYFFLFTGNTQLDKEVKIQNFTFNSIQKQEIFSGKFYKIWVKPID